jgi:kynurenine formamidase
VNGEEARVISLPGWMTAGAGGGGAAARPVDLSLPLTEATPVYPGDPEPRIFTATTVAAEGYNLSHVHLGTQTGTHIDAPFHFRDDGATVDRMPLALAAGPGVVVPVPGKGPGERITLADLAPYRERLAPGRIVLFATGWYGHAGTPRFYEHPYLAAEVGEAILAAGVGTIAIDTLNADFTGGDEFPIHDMFAQAGGFIAENLAGTADLTPGVEPLLLLLPLNLVGCDGAPVRAVALEPAPA